MRDRILIEELELSAHLGVPVEERAAPQRLTVTLALEPAAGLHAVEEDLTRTVDYAAVARSIQALARARPRVLLETLAEEIATDLLARHPLQAVEVTLHKYILPDTRRVAIQLRRTRS